MQRACLALALAALALPALSGCDGGGGCLIDSDCTADLSQVCIAQRCVEPGTTPDAGARDSGPEPDAGPPRDAGRDSGPPVMDDGGADASMEDGGGMPCADVTGAWTVGSILAPPCGAAMTGYGATIAAAATACELTVTSNDVATMPAIDGTFTLGADGNLMGTLSPGADPTPVECTGSLSGTTLTFVCGSCVMQLTR